MRKEQNQDNLEEVDMLERQNEEEERRHRQVRVRRQPERYGERPQQVAA